MMHVCLSGGYSLDGGVGLNRNHIYISFLLALVTLAVYWQAGSHDFINFDDNLYVTANPTVQMGLTREGFRWAFASTHAANWHPVTWLSHMSDVQLFGLDPKGHHLVSVLIHAVNGVLLFHLLYRMTGAFWRSIVTAALFSLHPLRVESVAWVAERKDQLSIMFGLLALVGYVRYTVQPTVIRFLPVVAAFALSLMSKPMLVTLPFVMLLLDYWPLKRWPFQKCDAANRPPSDLSARTLHLLAEKLPLLMLTVASCVITYYAQQSGNAIKSIPLLPRIENAVTAYVRYLGTFFYPVDLSIFYPLTPKHPSWQVVAALVVLVAVTAVAWGTARRYPYVVTGWLWFIGGLVPVIGLVQVGMQAMADRYTYFPMIGITIALVWGIADLTEPFPLRRPLLVIVTAVALCGSALLTSRQLAYWQSSSTLFRHAIDISDNNYVAWGYLGEYYYGQKRYQDAVRSYDRSLTINSRQADMQYNIGLAYFDLGEYEKAVNHYRESLAIEPGRPDAHYELALSYAALGRFGEALRNFELVVKAQPLFVKGTTALGIRTPDSGRLKRRPGNLPKQYD